jgi:hypothetical protein
VRRPMPRRRRHAAPVRRPRPRRRRHEAPDNATGCDDNGTRRQCEARPRGAHRADDQAEEVQRDGMRALFRPCATLVSGLSGFVGLSGGPRRGWATGVWRPGRHGRATRFLGGRGFWSRRFGGEALNHSSPWIVWRGVGAPGLPAPLASAAPGTLGSCRCLSVGCCRWWLFVRCGVFVGFVVCLPSVRRFLGRQLVPVGVAV